MYLKQSKLIWSIDWEVGWDKENSKLIWKDTGKNEMIHLCLMKSEPG